jgi:hypothetical protein
MSKYFGVIGNRDYIKIGGEKRPFWEFLDEQPDGWLSSLVYKRRDVPAGKPMIWDCGAWSYRNEAEPTYSPQQCSDLYREYAPVGSMVLAPDHMLIPGVDLDERRGINLKNAEAFLSVVAPGHVPMAAIHGETIGERIDMALALRRLGYDHLAVGGIAAQAARKAVVTDVVTALRGALPGAYLHVLGLSSPEYAKRWHRLGVDSFDGSSHFKQAFTAGAFYTVEGSKLTKHQAARPGNVDCDGIVAPPCSCTACSRLRADVVDTRSYGSNETNMGRAAHNMNMLMRAQKAARRRHVVLVACCGPKLPYAAPAKELYQSDLFRKSRAYAEQHGEGWLILSAEHGVVHPEATLAPYDKTLKTMPANERRAWADKVRAQLDTSDRYTVLAGNDYCGWMNDEFDTARPMEGLGIGQQLAWLLGNVKKTQEDLF